MQIIDISMPLSAETTVWPGDTLVQHRWNLRLEAGDSVNLSDWTLSAHAGTHIDAPLHYIEEGKTIEELSLEVFIGPCLVIEMAGQPEIYAEELDKVLPPSVERLLIRTQGWPDRSFFPESFPVVTADAIDLIASRGVRLLGVDVPSVDWVTSKKLPSHYWLGIRHNIAILESLWLADVEPGEYQLCALPLRLVGSDASPVRAVLIR